MKNFTRFHEHLNNKCAVRKTQLLILITLCTSLIGYAQTIGDTFVDSFITYEIISLVPNTIEVSDYDHSGSTDVVIPNTVTNGGTTYNVTSIGDDAFNYNGPTGKITSVTFTLPSNVTTIGTFAFRAQDITTVTIPSSVISIDEYAFWSNELTSVILENGLESIGANAFSANQITDIIIPNSVINIDQFAFQGNQLTSVTLSNSLISIGSAAFSQNQLQSIVIPNSVTSFSNAFSSNQLTSITLPIGITNIDVGAFRSNNLTHVTIPSTVTNIENTAFRNNPLATVTSQATTPPTIFTPGINDSFWNRSAIDLTIPSGTSAAYAAGGWTGFQSVTEANALAVGDTFVVDFITYEVTSSTSNTAEAIDYDIAGGTVVNIPASVSFSIGTYDVTSIDDSAFLQKGLTSVSIPDSVTFIGSNAFRDNLLTSISIPDSVTTMQGRAFENNNLETVIIGNGVPNIGSLTFYNNQIDNLIIGSGVLSISSNAFNANNLTSLIIPDSVTSIASNAFLDNELTNITFGNGLTNIGSSAFGVNQLVSITIPDNVTQIDNLAFRNNPLNSIIALATIPPTITTGLNDSFGNNRSNINLILTGNTTDEYVTDSGAQWTGFKMVFEAMSPTTAEVSHYDPANGTNVTIPAIVTAGSNIFDVTRIDDSAFENIGLTSVTIPNSVTSIGVSAFENNNLTSVSIPDSVTIIGTTAFATNAITNISLGNNVDIIGIGAFVDNNLTDIVIPSNVTEIGLLAFGNNPSLANVTSLAIVPPTITTGTNDTFIFDRSNTSLSIPAGTIGAYVTNPGALWTGFNPVTEDASLSTSDFELVNDVKVITAFGNIKIKHANSTILEQYNIYNISGAKVSTGVENEINTSSMAKGIYILKLDFDGGLVTKKILIK